MPSLCNISLTFNSQNLPSSDAYPTSTHTYRLFIFLKSRYFFNTSSRYFCNESGALYRALISRQQIYLRLNSLVASLRIPQKSKVQSTLDLLVAGTGFEPVTFGLWARRAARLLHPASASTLVPSRGETIASLGLKCQQDSGYFTVGVAMIYWVNQKVAMQSIPCKLELSLHEHAHVLEVCFSVHARGRGIVRDCHTDPVSMP